MTLMTRDRLVRPFELKAVSTSERTFEGYLSTWDADYGDDKVMPGAFARSLDHFRASGGRKVIPLIDQHDYSSIGNVLGKLVDGAEDAKGLWTKWKVAPTARGDEALTLIEGGFVAEMSMGYEAVRYEFAEGARVDGTKGTLRHLLEVKLMEGSTVIWAMQPNATIDAASVKCLMDAARAGRLTDEQKSELRALLTDEPAPEPAPAPEAPAHYEKQDELRQTLLRLKLRSLVTRAA